MTDAREEFHRHAVLMLREAEQAETAIRRRLGELTGTVRCTAVVATMQFAMREIVAGFLVSYPRSKRMNVERRQRNDAGHVGRA